MKRTEGSRIVNIRPIKRKFKNRATHCSEPSTATNIVEENPIEKNALDALKSLSPPILLNDSLDEGANPEKPEELNWWEFPPLPKERVIKQETFNDKHSVYGSKNFLSILSENLAFGEIKKKKDPEQKKLGLESNKLSGQPKPLTAGAMFCRFKSMESSSRISELKEIKDYLTSPKEKEIEMMDSEKKDSEKIEKSSDSGCASTNYDDNYSQNALSLESQPFLKDPSAPSFRTGAEKCEKEEPIAFTERIMTKETDKSDKSPLIGRRFIIFRMRQDMEEKKDRESKDQDGALAFSDNHLGNSERHTIRENSPRLNRQRKVMLNNQSKLEEKFQIRVCGRSLTPTQYSNSKPAEKKLIPAIPCRKQSLDSTSVIQKSVQRSPKKEPTGFKDVMLNCNRLFLKNNQKFLIHPQQTNTPLRNSTLPFIEEHLLTGSSHNRGLSRIVLGEPIELEVNRCRNRFELYKYLNEKLKNGKLSEFFQRKFKR